MSTVFGNDKNMNGVINVYKEKGYTSHDVVAKLRGILKIKKTGHTGTLDPDAQGVLPVCIGNATKLCDFIMEKNKEYDAELILGKKTDTQDISGRIIEVSDHYRYLTRQEVEQCIDGFVGEYKQIPPMYSAIKVNGKKLYELARQGIEIERKARNVTIRGIDIISFDMPVIRIKVKCSRGTYIRTLCNDSSGGSIRISQGSRPSGSIDQTGGIRCWRHIREDPTKMKDMKENLRSFRER